MSSESMMLMYVDEAPAPSGMVATMAYAGLVPAGPPGGAGSPPSSLEHAASAANVVIDKARAAVELKLKIILRKPYNHS